MTDILFEEIPGVSGNLGLITLNRPKVLNALNHSMFTALYEKLKQWEKQNSIKAVVIRAAEGRAFCAGGDIRHAYELKKANDVTLTQFFKDEYKMNLQIHHYPKPYIALLDGITMGGGAGISIHGSHRVGTHRLVFAMPETNIGFYPDVGMTYVLARLPYKMGIYLGLTGAKISYADCLALGIVQDITTEEQLPKIIDVLAETPLANNAAVTHLLKQFNTNVPASELMSHQQEIENCFAKNSVEEIVLALEKYPTEWCQQTASIIKTKSPTSLKITFEALKKAKDLSFDACMAMETRLTLHFLEGHDFFEGIRSVVIDKDQNPQWKPKTLADVSSLEVEKYFEVINA